MSKLQNLAQEEVGEMSSVQDSIRSILEAEARAIANVQVDATFEAAVKSLLDCRGKVFTTGIGKAGYVAKKAASTFSTTGTPSVYLHPGDASHGDVGVISTEDILFSFSNSGRTREVLETVRFSRMLGIKQILAITGCPDSPIGHESDLILSIGEIEEPCPLKMTPSASTSAMVAVADALALTAMRERGFTQADFAARHHGGYLGEKSRGET